MAKNEDLDVGGGDDAAGQAALAVQLLADVVARCERDGYVGTDLQYRLARDDHVEVVVLLQPAEDLARPTVRPHGVVREI